jgi:hypothetical protein
MRSERFKYDGTNYGVDIILDADEISSDMKQKIEAQSKGTVIEEVSGAANVTESGPSIGETHYLIPEGALASYKQLLGTSSDRETIQYIMYIREHGEPEVQADGTNVWTSAYEEVESKLALRASTNEAVKVESQQNELQNIDASTDEQNRKLEEKTEVVASNAARAIRRISRAKLKASKNLLSTSSSKPTGIDKTRSMLGLPSRNIRKMAKVRLMRVASANALASESSSEVKSDDTFYDIPDDILSTFDQDNVSKANDNFLDSLKPRW